MKFFISRLARLRLRALLFVNNVYRKVLGTPLSRLIRNRRFLVAAYMLAVLALAGAWWWDSPNRFLGERPPFTPPERETPVVIPPPVDPVVQPAGETPADPPKETVLTPPEQPATAAPPVAPPAAVPAMAAPVTIDTLHRPVAGEIVKQYGFRWSATHQDFRYHFGIGIAATPGSPVVAAYPGRVKTIETNHPEWGTRVVVDHGGGWRTEYANIASVAVRVGQDITARQALGQVGPNSPTRVADEPHLYFALFKGDESQDPAPKLKH